MSSAGKFFNLRSNKYAKLNLLVVLVILLALFIVFFWYEKKVKRIETEMTRQGLTAISNKKPGWITQACSSGLLKSYRS
jgi:hypothetical protein